MLLIVTKYGFKHAYWQIFQAAVINHSFNQFFQVI